MNLTMSGRFVDNGDACRAFDLMPGKDFPTVGAKIISPDMLQVEVSRRDRLLVDGCGELRVKFLDPAITLLTGQTVMSWIQSDHFLTICVLEKLLLLSRLNP